MGAPSARLLFIDIDGYYHRAEPTRHCAADHQRLAPIVSTTVGRRLVELPGPLQTEEFRNHRKASRLGDFLLAMRFKQRHQPWFKLPEKRREHPPKRGHFATNKRRGTSAFAAGHRGKPRFGKTEMCPARPGPFRPAARRVTCREKLPQQEESMRGERRRVERPRDWPGALSKEISAQPPLFPPQKTPCFALAAWRSETNRVRHSIERASADCELADSAEWIGGASTGWWWCRETGQGNMPQRASGQALQHPLAISGPGLRSSIFHIGPFFNRSSSLRGVERCLPGGAQVSVFGEELDSALEFRFLMGPSRSRCLTSRSSRKKGASRRREPQVVVAKTSIPGPGNDVFRRATIKRENKHAAPGGVACGAPATRQAPATATLRTHPRQETRRVVSCFLDGVASRRVPQGEPPGETSPSNARGAFAKVIDVALPVRRRFICYQLLLSTSSPTAPAWAVSPCPASHLEDAWNYSVLTPWYPGEKGFWFFSNWQTGGNQGPGRPVFFFFLFVSVSGFKRQGPLDFSDGGWQYLACSHEPLAEAPSPGRGRGNLFDGLSFVSTGPWHSGRAHGPRTPATHVTVDETKRNSVQVLWTFTPGGQGAAWPGLGQNSFRLLISHRLFLPPLVWQFMQTSCRGNTACGWCAPHLVALKRQGYSCLLARLGPYCGKKAMGAAAGEIVWLNAGCVKAARPTVPRRGPRPTTLPEESIGSACKRRNQSSSGQDGGPRGCASGSIHRAYGPRAGQAGTFPLKVV